MTRFKGVGSAKAIFILTALELGLRSEVNLNNQLQIKSSSDAFQIFKSVLAYLNIEKFWVLYLNSFHKIIDKVQISKCDINSALIDICVILKQALLCLSISIVLAHNHPSGNLKSSGFDIALTKKISDAATLLNIQVLDYLVIGDSDFLSFKEEGLI